MVIGIVFIYLGYVVFSKKAPGVLDLFLKLGITAEDEKSAKFFGTIIVITGVVIISLPFILGTEKMNI